jgi:hypothetical protein
MTPLASFIVTCPSCATDFPVDPGRVPELGVMAICSTCQRTFRVSRPEGWTASAAAPVEAAGAEVDAQGHTRDDAPLDAQDDAHVDTQVDAWDGGSTSVEAPASDAEPDPGGESDGPESAELRGEPGPEEPSELPGTLVEEIVRPPLDADAGEDAEEAAPGTAWTRDAAVDTPAEAPLASEAGVEEEAEVEVESELEGEFEIEPEPEPEVEAELEADVEDDVELDAGATAEEEAEVEPASDDEGAEGMSRFGRRDPANRARRLARVLASDMITYNPARYAEARSRGTLREDFLEEIEKSWEEYVDQVGESFARSTSHFVDALNEVLAQGEILFRGPGRPH